MVHCLTFAAGIVIEEKNWPPFFPIIHHDIANEIPIHVQRMQYFAFASLLGMTSASANILAVVLYFSIINDVHNLLNKRNTLV